MREDQEPDVSKQSPLTLLLSDSEEEVVKQVHVSNGSSRSQLARVDIHGIPADGVVDTAADITIMGGKLFALVAAVAKLRKSNFKKPDIVPRNYDGREFHLDGWLYGDGDHFRGQDTHHNGLCQDGCRRSAPSL